MIENLRFYSGFLTLLSGIIGLLLYHKLPTFKSKLVLATVWVSVLVEFVGKYFTQWTGLLNYFVFNVYNLIIFSVYIIILDKLFKKQINKRLATIFLVLFLLSFLANALFFGKELEQRIITNFYATGVVFISVLSLLYLVELYNSDYILNYSKSIFFWFILGILIFHVPFLPFMLSLDWFLIKFNSSVYGIIVFFLNLLMNSCFIFGFLCSEKKYNY